jgi:hypothetical protein
MDYDSVKAWQETCNSILEARNKAYIAVFEDLQKRVVNVEQQVANQAKLMHAHAELPTVAGIKSQAAAAQATEHLYAPLRSDTKPLLEMAAFVRKVSATRFQDLDDRGGWSELRHLVQDAQDLLKRLT